MSLFTPRQLSCLERFTGLYRGFTAPWDFELPPDLMQECIDFAQYKGWRGIEKQRFINSKKADYLMVGHAQRNGFVAELNNELVTKTPWHDFSIIQPDLGLPFEQVKFESKRMPGAEVLEIAFLWPFHKTESCMKWRDFDVFVAWYVDDLDRFKPWALLANRLLAADMWNTIWVPNNGDKGGRHLPLSKLAKEHLEGVVLL